MTNLAICSLLLASLIPSDCTRTSVGLIPINDLGTGAYLGQYAGGLYLNGSNFMPAGHARIGRGRAVSVRPLDASGSPHPEGRIVFMSIGMSNTAQEFSQFMTVAQGDSELWHNRLTILNGASGGQTAGTWDSPDDANYNRVRDQILTPRGLSELQVQALWVKVANAGPTVRLPNSNADAFNLLRQMGSIARALKVRYPNARVVFFSSRIYAGYADTTLNPEPYAYESGFAVKWLIEAQMRQMQSGQIDPTAGDLNHNTVAPWIAWGPYLWADGLTPRSDGLTYECLDLNNDGTHPSPQGRRKVAQLLMDFLKSSPHSSSWFTVYPPGDVNRDRTVDDTDLAMVLEAFGENCRGCPSDLNGDGTVDDIDLSETLAFFGLRR